MTCIGVLFATWHKDISDALNRSGLTGDRKKEHVDLLGELLRFRALPIAASSTLLALVLLWPLVQVICGIRFGRDYDPVAACFVVVYLVILVLAVSAVKTAVSVMRRRSVLR
jgi:hypothetical protein